MEELEAIPMTDFSPYVNPPKTMESTAEMITGRDFVRL